MQFDQHIAAALAELDRQGLRRRARAIDGAQGPTLVVDGKAAICLCSNNYLGLAAHPALIEAGIAGLRSEGVGSGASRLVSGSMAAHREAEAALAAFAGHADSILFSAGYPANVGSVQALVGKGDVVFSDSLNHASLIDGARLSRAQVVVYEHADADSLRSALRAQRSRGRAALVLTESLFSMDGDIAPLADIAALSREFDAGLLVDDAHALGVYGPEGRGLCAALGVVPDVLIGTLGKAFGAQGAFAAASAPTVDLIRNRARSYVFSTAPSPAIARTAIAAIELVRRADDRRARLTHNVQRLRSGLSALGYRVLPGDSPIIPVMIGEPGPTMALSAALLERGVFAHGIRPPTVPAGTGRLRVVPIATHTDEHLSAALAAFAEIRA